MKALNWKKLIPHGVAVLIFLALSVFSGRYEFQGKELSAHDDMQWKGSAKESQDFEKANGVSPGWTESMFGGMPTYLITFRPQNSFIATPARSVVSLGFPRTVANYWVALLGFYVLMITFGVSPVMAIFGSIAFAFTTYFTIIMGAGHFAKNLAISYFPWVLAGINLTFNKKYLIGGILIGLFMLLEVFANHIQMTYYYFMFFVSLFMLYKTIELVRKREIKHLLVSYGIIGFFIACGVLGNLNRLLPTQEYTAYSTRGKSSLTRLKDTGDQTAGLDRSYIVDYSYGKSEVWSFLIPNYKGGGNRSLADNPTAVNAVNANEKQVLGSFDQYWGVQKGSAGAIYFGVAVVMLFVLGMIFIKSSLKYYVLASVVVTVMLSWGKNYMGMTNLFIDYFPMYSKFRSVNSILIVAQFCFPFLATLALYEFSNRPGMWSEMFKIGKSVTKFTNRKVALAVLGFFVLILASMAAMPTTLTSFSTKEEVEEMVGMYAAQVAQEQGIEVSQLAPDQIQQMRAAVQNMMPTAEKARVAVFRADVGRTAVFLLLFAVILWFLISGKLKPMYAAIGLTVLTFIDLSMINGRYFGESRYKEKSTGVEFALSNADKQILQDKALSYRVLNFSNPFNEAKTSYFHKSIGGYHGAKMENYQELIEFQLNGDMNYFYTLPGRMNETNADSLLSDLHALNMLNTKYFILRKPGGKEQMVFLNQAALGNAWFVKHGKLVPTPDDELELISRYDPQDTVLVHESFGNQIAAFKYQRDSAAFIQMTEYSPVHLTYEYQSSLPQFTVFSEIYYDKGWNLYVDGNKVEYFRVNHVLRAAVLPAGKFKIEWKFEPVSVTKGEQFAMIGNLGIMGGIGLLIAGTFLFRRKKQQIAA